MLTDFVQGCFVGGFAVLAAEFLWVAWKMRDWRPSR